MRKILGAAAVAALTLPGALLVTAPAQAADNAMVSVLHGIPGVTVDVYVNNKLTLDNFKPGTLAGPLSLPAGTYSIKVTDPTDATKVIIGPASVPVQGGMNYTIVAFLGTDGKPTAKPFVNDISTVPAGQGRVTVRHVANAPAVKVTAGGATLIPSLANGSEAVATVPAKTYPVAVLPAAGGAAVFSTNLPVTEGANTIVYAYGDLAGGTFAAKVQTITGLQSMPNGVPAGNGGLADDSPAFPLWGFGLVAAGLVGAGLSARRLTATRSQV